MSRNNETTKCVTLINSAFTQCKGQHVHKWIVQMHMQPHQFEPSGVHNPFTHLCQSKGKTMFFLSRQWILNCEFAKVERSDLHFTGAACLSTLCIYELHTGKWQPPNGWEVLLDNKLSPMDLIAAHLEPLTCSSSILLSSSQENKNHALKSPI